MLSPQEAYEAFKKKKPNTMAEKVSEFESVYLISDCRNGDLVDDDYTIDKNSGEVKAIDFVECTELIKALGDVDPPEYSIKNGKVTKRGD